MSIITPPIADLTAEELAERVGAVPLWRIRMAPPPGTATEGDVERVLREEDRICELIDGVLVEKAMSDETSILAAELIFLLVGFVKPRRLGWVLAPDGFVRLLGGRLRAPDVSFVRHGQRPAGRPLKRGYSSLVPAVAVEIFSPGNTSREMNQKREEFFAAGTELFWIVYPDREEIEVYASPRDCRILRCADLLDGGTVLPGFSIKVAELFAALDLGPNEGPGGRSSC